jgi:hypothetical protein
LPELLPAQVSGQVLERVESARAEGLPVEAMAELALEGVAKGRSAAEVLAAVEALAADMSTAQDAIIRADRAPEDREIEAATATLRMGVDRWMVSELAQEQPSGRSLAVPLLIVGSLVDRGLPSDEAVAAVRDRLAAGASDGELLGDFPGAGPSTTQSPIPADGDPELGAGFAGLQIPIAGAPVWIPGRVGSRPGGI